MITLLCEWGCDLSVGPSGDINLVAMEVDARQRVIRRLLTNPNDYIWHTDYGAGLGSQVGSADSSSFIKGVILSQLKLETMIAPTPAPAVQVEQPSSGTFLTTSVVVRYQVVGNALADSIVLGLGKS